MRIIDLGNDVLQFKCEQEDGIIYHYFEVKIPYLKVYGTHFTTNHLHRLRENCRRILDATDFITEDETCTIAE